MKRTKDSPYVLIHSASKNDTRHYGMAQRVLKEQKKQNPTTSWRTWNWEDFYN